MGFAGNDFFRVQSRIKKYEMFKQLQQSDLKCAQSFTIDSYDELESLHQIINFPMFIKPVDSAGNDGCKRVNDFNELSSSFKEIHGCYNFLGKKNS